MDTLSRLAHIQAPSIHQTITASIRWDRMVPDSGVNQSELLKLVILVGSARPNVTKVVRSANIARTTISSVSTEMCLFRSRTNRLKR